jgi:chaperonin GroES
MEILKNKNMDSKKLQPLGDRVLVKVVKEDKNKKTKSGIIIPDSVTAEDVKFATVVAVGPGLYTHNGNLIPMTVEVGDEVVLPSFHQAQKLKFDGEEYDILRESELIAVLKNS